MRLLPRLNVMSNSIISAKDITKAVDGRQLLADISFEIEEQSLVSLIGPNGAGKSTLVKIILGLDTQFTGTVTIAKNERVQYIPQLSTSDQHQLPMSVEEYLRIATSPLYNKYSKHGSFNYAKELEHVGVSAEKLHQSYLSLSGGERQRVAIARALLGKPTVLVLDEPLAAVDYTSRGGLYELIRHLQRDHKMTVLLVSHDIESVLPLSDRVFYLNKTLHTDCHPSEFLTKDRTYQTIHHHC